MEQVGRKLYLSETPAIGWEAKTLRSKMAHFIVPQRVPSILASGPNSIFWFERVPQIAWKVTPVSVISKIQWRPTNNDSALYIDRMGALSDRLL
jgi:hypothetical protein